MADESRIRPGEVREIAQLARLDLDDAEVEHMTRDLDAILGYVETLREVAIEGVEPMTHAVPFDCPMRADEIRPPLAVDEALANAPRREASFFQVPRVVPGTGGGPSEDEP